MSVLQGLTANELAPFSDLRWNGALSLWQFLAHTLGEELSSLLFSISKNPKETDHEKNIPLAP